MRRHSPAQEQSAKPTSAWNSLEIVKLIMSAITPLTIGALGAYISYNANKASTNQAIVLQRDQFSNNNMQSIFLKRQSIWDEVGPRIKTTFLNSDPDLDGKLKKEHDLKEWKDIQISFEEHAHYFSSEFSKIVRDRIVNQIRSTESDITPSGRVVTESTLKAEGIDAESDLILDAVVPCEIGTQICNVSNLRASIMKKFEIDCILGRKHRTRYTPWWCT